MCSNDYMLHTSPHIHDTHTHIHVHTDEHDDLESIIMSS